MLGTSVPAHQKCRFGTSVPNPQKYILVQVYQIFWHTSLVSLVQVYQIPQNTYWYKCTKFSWMQVWYVWYKCTDSSNMHIGTSVPNLPACKFGKFGTSVPKPQKYMLVQVYQIFQNTSLGSLVQVYQILSTQVWYTCTRGSNIKNSGIPSI